MGEKDAGPHSPVDRIIGENEREGGLDGQEEHINVLYTPSLLSSAMLFCFVHGTRERRRPTLFFWSAQSHSF